MFSVITQHYSKWSVRYYNTSRLNSWDNPGQPSIYELNSLYQLGWYLYYRPGFTKSPSLCLMNHHFMTTFHCPAASRRWKLSSYMQKMCPTEIVQNCHLILWWNYSPSDVLILTTLGFILCRRSRMPHTELENWSSLIFDSQNAFSWSFIRMCSSVAEAWKLIACLCVHIFIMSIRLVILVWVICKLIQMHPWSYVFMQFCVKAPGLRLKMVFPCMVISITKIKQSWDCLIFIMGNPIPAWWHFYIESAPRP